MTTLVTGGAGYIGAHVVERLVQSGRDVVIVDDLSTSTRDRVPEVPLHVMDLAAAGASSLLADVMRDVRATEVVHLAAKKQVGESVRRPEWYVEQNMGALVATLTAARSVGCGRLVFSSSAAVYGAPVVGRVDEDAPLDPINPYGRTKLAGEWLVRDAARAWGLRQVSLRYFNVAGAAAPRLGDPAVLNLVTQVFDRIENGQRPQVFGSDYPTPDGTCVRDYIHVSDLADAHLVALDHLGRDQPMADVFNIGRGRGASVLEVLAEIARVAGEASPELVGRRAGDPPELVAVSRRAEHELGWRARHDLASMVESAWAAWRHQRDTGVPVMRAGDTKAL